MESLRPSRACAKKVISMGISSFSNFAVEDVVQAGRKVGPLAHVMQLYTMKDRSLQERIIKRAEAAGCVAIFLTADSPVMGVRYNEWRNDFRTPAGLAFPMLEKTSEMIQALTHDDGFLSFNSDAHCWAYDIPWLEEQDYDADLDQGRVDRGRRASRTRIQVRRHHCAATTAAGSSMGFQLPSMPFLNVLRQPMAKSPYT